MKIQVEPMPPKNFAPPEAWSEYGYVAMPKTICAREEVGTSPKGIRWGLGPIVFEEYTTDEEPQLDNSGTLARPRFVAWRRITRSDVPSGWYQLSKQPFRIDGYAVVDHAYAERWQKNARRDLRLWQENFLHKSYEIEVLSFDEFCATYAHSTVARKIGLELLRVLERKLALPTAHHIKLWGVRNKNTGAIIAGTAAVYSPSQSASIRECPFILPEARHCFAMTGLMAHWFDHSLREGITLHQFTHFRQKGDPRDWRGFSEFKSHFVDGLVAAPPALWRFATGKIF
jgi:hypothetical protein